MDRRGKLELVIHDAVTHTAAAAIQKQVREGRLDGNKHVSVEAWEILKRAQESKHNCWKNLPPSDEV
jgi:hypothetical protein